MSVDVWDELQPQLVTEHNRIYIEKFGSDAVPGNYIVITVQSVGSGPVQPNPEEEEIGRIISRSNSTNKELVNLNIFKRPRHLPLRHHGRIGPLSTPSTAEIGELVQTTEVRQVERAKFGRIAYVFHNEVLSSNASTMYLTGMKDVFVIRYRYDANKDM